MNEKYCLCTKRERKKKKKHQTIITTDFNLIKVSDPEIYTASPLIYPSPPLPLYSIRRNHEAFSRIRTKRNEEIEIRVKIGEEKNKGRKTGLPRALNVSLFRSFRIREIFLPFDQFLFHSYLYPRLPPLFLSLSLSLSFLDFEEACIQIIIGAFLFEAA